MHSKVSDSVDIGLGKKLCTDDLEVVIMYEYNKLHRVSPMFSFYSLIVCILGMPLASLMKRKVRVRLQTVWSL
jgi:hypothetical protein